MMVDMELQCCNISELIWSIAVAFGARGMPFSLCSSCPGYVRSPESKVQLPSTGDLRKERLPEHDEGTHADLLVLRELTEAWGTEGEAGRC